MSMRGGISIMKETDLKSRIVKSGKSRAELADAVGVQYSTLSQYLNGYITMPGDVRARIEKELEK